MFNYPYFFLIFFYFLLPLTGSGTRRRPSVYPPFRPPAVPSSTLPVYFTFFALVSAAVSCGTLGRPFSVAYDAINRPCPL